MKSLSYPFERPFTPIICPSTSSVMNKIHLVHFCFSSVYTHKYFFCEKIVTANHGFLEKNMETG